MCVYFEMIASTRQVNIISITHTVTSECVCVCVCVCVVKILNIYSLSNFQMIQHSIFHCSPHSNQVCPSVPRVGSCPYFSSKAGKSYEAGPKALLNITSPSDNYAWTSDTEDRLSWKVLVSFSFFTNKDVLLNPWAFRDQTK